MKYKLEFETIVPNQVPRLRIMKGILDVCYNDIHISIMVQNKYDVSNINLSNLKHLIIDPIFKSIEEGKTKIIFLEDLTKKQAYKIKNELDINVDKSVMRFNVRYDKPQKILLNF